MNKIKTRLALIALIMMLGATVLTTNALAEPMQCNLPVTNYHYRDSAKIVKNGYTTYDIKVSMPNLGEHITQVVRDSIFAYITEAEGKASAGTLPVDLYQGFDKAFKKKANKFFDLHKGDANDEPEMRENGYPYYYEMEISPEAACSEFVTMYFTGYEYWGGAHGMPYEYGITFRTSDGHAMEWSDFTKRPEFLRPTISKHLDPNLLDDPTKIRPLPAITPWLRGDNLVFKYSAYEIAPYASGMPEAEVHYSEITEYLTPEIIKMCNTYDDENESGSGDDCDNVESPDFIYDTLVEPNERKVVGQPNIKSFVSAVLDVDTAHEGQFDMRNGYWEFSEEGDGSIRYNAAYWNRTDGSKLFIVSYCATLYVPLNPQTGLPRHGIATASNPWMFYDFAPSEDGDGTYGYSYESGYVTYIYDAKRKVLTHVSDMNLLGDMSDVNTHRYLILPQQGKDIKVREGNPHTNDFRYRTLRWNGMKFIDGMKQRD